jgi:hypothetical protein
VQGRDQQRVCSTVNKFYGLHADSSSPWALLRTPMLLSVTAPALQLQPEAGDRPAAS